jgi:hypothetical protein
MAVKDVHAADGVIGRQVETVVRDSEFKAEVGRTPLSQQI